MRQSERKRHHFEICDCRHLYSLVWRAWHYYRCNIVQIQSYCWRKERKSERRRKKKIYRIWFRVREEGNGRESVRYLFDTQFTYVSVLWHTKKYHVSLAYMRLFCQFENNVRGNKKKKLVFLLLHIFGALWYKSWFCIPSILHCKKPCLGCVSVCAIFKCNIA